MKSNFDPAEFVRRIGLDLIRAFDDAREATTPELVGDAMEQPVRERLEQILPRGIGVGSGCVIDTKGGTSRQMDVVLYEKDLCPVFCINNSPETTYYPAEGVLAVGEVKSAIGKRELADSFQKIRSVKALQRSFVIMDDGIYVGRRYGDHGSGAAYGFYRDHTNKGDIFGFVLAERASLAITLPDPSRTHKSAPKATLLGHYADNIQQIGDDVMCPDLIVLLDGTLLTPQAILGSEPGTEPITEPYVPTRVKNSLPHLLNPCQADSPFGELVKEVWKRHQGGLTAHIPLEQYLHYQATTEPRLTWAAFANVTVLEDARTGMKVAQPRHQETPTDHVRNDLVLLGKKEV
ncbi:MAG: hypothetical protein F4Z00_11160 [Acidimicrobiaceae bacterium]|nr:hypothetical protein [Acidimicrobiaceae bacterium]MXZ66087.1 hypothetical protein [Acidimicrobiaceae bacterium]MYF33022.1 hypothetical protein [Acidimicrobiaceae bacterium]MYG79677.1 hypothetical protein [Acidimicrobiaceae bacterium]MYJ28673.1 hypothetical protein [Acidimicrobiaceae bacterium]